MLTFLKKHEIFFKHIFFIKCILISVGFNCQTSNSKLKVFSGKEGLSVDFIKTMCFDNEGFLWLAGENNNVRSIINNNKRINIQRFDGKNFHDFELPKYTEEIISIEGLQKRDDGNIYIRAIVNSGQMLLLFNPYTATFNPVQFSKDITIIDALSNVFQFKNQEYILTQKGKTIFVNTISKSLEIKPVFSFFPETSKKYLLETSTQFIPFSDFVIISDDNFKPVLLTWKGEILKTFNENHFKSVFIENNKTFLITADDNNFLEIDVENKLLIKTKSSKINGDVIDVFSDNYGNISTVILKDKLASIYSIKKGNLQEKLLSFPMIDKDYIIGKSKDISQGFWLGTNYTELKFFKKTNYSKNFLTSNSIRCLTSLSDDKLLLATENQGWFTINTRKNSVSPFKIISKKKKLKPYSSRNFIKDNGFIWSNDHDNIIRVNTKNGDAESWNHYPVICMEKANDSLIVYGTKEYYLMLFNTKTKQHKKLLKTDSLFIYDVAIKKNIVACATNKGLLEYNLKTNKSYFYNTKKGLEDDFILMIDKHPKHQFVLGTKSGKVITYNPKKNSFKTIYSDNLKTGIATISYDNNLWWINTFNGLVAFDIDTKKSTRFSEIDGLSHNEGNRYSALLTKDKLLIGSLRGLSAIDKNSIRKKEKNAELVLLSIAKYESNSKKFKTINNRKSLESNIIKLPAEYKNLDINFALTNQLENSDHNYRYKIDNNNWVELNNQQQINFINLAAGTYTLQIEAIDFSGNVIASPLELFIISQEFFYKTWWFYLLIFVLLSLVFIWQLYQTRQKQILQQQFSQDLIQSTEEERTRIAKELHDSVNQQLTLIKKQTQKLELDSISGMVNNTLEEVRSISRNLYPSILKQLGPTESIEQLLLDVDETTDLFITTDIENIDVYFDDKQALNLYRIIQEIIANVLKHADAKSFLLEIIKDKNQIKIVAEDNGKGFDVTEGKKNYSLGLKTLAERVDILKGELSIESEPKKGTKTVITIFIQ